MSIKIKVGGSYVDAAGVFTKKAGTYQAVQGVFAKVGGIYQQVDAISASAVSATGGGSTVTVTWITAINAYSRVQFGTAPGVYTGQVDDIVSAVTSHSVVLDAADGIVSGSTYYYRVGSSSNGISWSYSGEYSVATVPPSVARFDIAASASAGGWTDGQNITSLASTNSADVLNGTAARYPTYNAADSSMRFSGTQVISNESLTAFSEILVVLTDTGVNNFNYVFTAHDATPAGPAMRTANVGTNWYVNATPVAGRQSGVKQVVLLRTSPNTVHVRTVRNAADVENTATQSGVPNSFTRFYMPDRPTNVETENAIIHEVVLCPALTADQRNSWISLLKTKHGI